MNEKIFEKIDIKTVLIIYSNVPQYEISVNLANFRFWEQICQKNMNDKNFEKINIKIITSM